MPQAFCSIPHSWNVFRVTMASRRYFNDADHHISEGNDVAVSFARKGGAKKCCKIISLLLYQTFEK